MGSRVNSVDLERNNEVDSQSGCTTTVAQIDQDRERHLDHYRILSQQSASAEVRDQRIRTYMRMRHRPKSGTQIVMIVSDWHTIVESIEIILSKRTLYVIVSKRETSSCHQKLTNRYHIASKRSKSYQNVSTGITSYPSLKFQRNPTISYEWPSFAFATDRTTVGTQHNQ